MRRRPEAAPQKRSPKKLLRGLGDKAAWIIGDSWPALAVPFVSEGDGAKSDPSKGDG